MSLPELKLVSARSFRRESTSCTYRAGLYFISRRFILDHQNE
jgi:hypothetical protein